LSGGLIVLEKAFLFTSKHFILYLAGVEHSFDIYGSREGLREMANVCGIIVTIINLLQLNRGIRKIILTYYE